MTLHHSARLPEAEAEGCPRLELREEDVAAVSDLLADMLVDALDHEERAT